MSKLDRYSPRDLEKLSAYLDGELAARQAAKLEAQLNLDAELKSALEELRATAAAVGTLPTVPPPRNFMLTTEMAGRPHRARIYPVLQLSTALAGLALVITLGADALLATRQAAAPLALDAELGLERAAELQRDLELQPEQTPAAPLAASEVDGDAAAEQATAAFEEGDALAAEQAADTIEEGEALAAEPAPEDEQRAAAESIEEAPAETPAPLSTLAPEAGFFADKGEAISGTEESSLSRQELRDVRPLKPAVGEPAIDDLSPDQLAGSSSRPAIAPIRVAEIGLGIVTLVLLALTVLLRARG